LLAEHYKNQIQAASNDKTALRVRGGGTKDWYGETPSGAILDTRAYTGIIDYEPTELVITARCGTPLVEIEAALAAQRQMLAFEPPHFGAGATIGGVMGCALSGPRRASAGAMRDFVLGAVLIDGRGERLAFGGQVMKNVAGYDVSRLLAGSMGTLGLILDVSIKVLPLPFAQISLRFAISEIEALTKLNAWAGQPLPISASCWHDGVLTLRLAGAQAAVNAARQKLGGDIVDDDSAFWLTVREQTHPFFADASTASLWRLSVPSNASALVLKGQQLIEWGGAQRWLKLATAPDQDTAARIRTIAAAAGGHATLFKSDRSDAAGAEVGAGVGVFQPLTAPLARIHQRMKLAFDPAGIFNPGRMYKEF
jgi:glycolate oxidase FAD binding subunit